MRLRLLVALISLAAFLVACDGDDDEPSDGTPPPTSPTASATEDPTGESLRIGDAVPIPEDVALTIQTGCWQCDGPVESFVRLRRLPDGSIEELTLFSPDIYGHVTGAGFDTGGTGAVAISTCRPGCDGFNEPTGEEQTNIHESFDGGVTYGVGHLPGLDGWYSVVGVNAGTALVSGPVGAPEPLPLRRMRDLSEVTPPPGGFNPYVLSAEIVWSTENRDTLLGADGATILNVPGEQIVDVTELIHAGRLAVLSFRLSGGEQPYVLRILDRDVTTTIERTYGGQFILIGGSLDQCTAVGNADVPLDLIPTPEGGLAFVGFLPAVIDFCGGVIHPITDPFLREPYFNGRNLVEHVQQGPFVSVSSDVGNCRHVRAEPSADSESLGCFGAGVLLVDRDETQQGDAQTWHLVLTPAHSEGWVSEEWLAP